MAPDVFDHEVDPRRASAFLTAPHHHLVVATLDGLVIGFASAFHDLHPDKPPELFVNEVGVAPHHRRQGLGKRLLHALFAAGRSAGCNKAWLLTTRANRAARALFASMGGQEAPEGAVLVTFDLRPSPRPSRGPFPPPQE